MKNSIIYGIGNLSAKLVGFILLPLYTSHLSVADYGALSVLEISAQLIISVFGLALYQAFDRWYWDPELKNKQKSVFFTVFVFLIIVSGLVILVLTIGSRVLSGLLFKNANYAGLIELMVFASAFQIVNVLPMTLMKLQSRSIFYTVSNLIQFTANLVFTILFITEFNQKINGIYQAQIIGSAVYLIILSRYIFQNIEFKFELTVLKEMLVYSFPLMLSSISGIVLSIADRYCINFITGLSELGAYSLGYKIANSVKVLLVTSVQLSINPMIYQMMDKSGNKRFYSKIMLYFCFGVLFCVLGLSIFSKEIVYLLASSNKEYWDAYKVIPLLSFAVLFGMLKDTSLIGLNLSKKTKIIGLVTIIISVLNVILNVILISLLHSIGASIAALVSNILFFWIIYHYAQKYYYVPYEIKKIVILITLGMGIYGISLINFPIPNVIRYLLKFGLIFSMPVVLYFLRFYEEAELEVIKGTWRKWRNPLNWKKNLSRIKLGNK